MEIELLLKILLNLKEALIIKLILTLTTIKTVEEDPLLIRECK